MKVYEKRRVFFIVIACCGISTIVFARGFGVIFLGGGGIGDVEG